SVNRILIKDTQNNKILGLKEFFDAFSITPPENFYNTIENNPTLFINSQEEGNRFGLVVEIADQDGLAEILASWEGKMEEDFEKLFELWEKDAPALVPYFKDAKYQETNFCFQTFNKEDLGVVYAIFNKYFIITTSWKSMEKALDRLKEAAASSFLGPNDGAEFVLAGLSLKEKIGQLFFIGIDGTTLTPKTEELINEIHPGGILLLKKNISDEAQTKKLIQDLQRVAQEGLGIPFLIGVDQEGDPICSVGFSKEKTSQSEIKSPEQAYQIGLSRGEELRALGINLNLAPVLDAAQPGDFVFSRVFSKDAEDPGAIAKALILGQKTASILTAIKHFPGYGDIAFDPEDELAVLEDIPEIALFKTAAQAQPEFVMMSNVIYSEIDPSFPLSFSQKGVALLKESVGPEPLIITDDLPQSSLIDKFSLKGVITLPIRAGADILTFSTNWETTLQEASRILEEAVQNGEISEARINESVLKIIKLKWTYYNYE
ncbi:MAG: glycoside hydrolase family 3 N-terminal domain-containing protein, partial [Candidatus Nealsonbacteria bacterium]